MTKKLFQQLNLIAEDVKVLLDTSDWLALKNETINKEACDEMFQQRLKILSDLDKLKLNLPVNQYSGYINDALDDLVEQINRLQIVFDKIAFQDTI